MGAWSGRLFGRHLVAVPSISPNNLLGLRTRRSRSMSRVYRRLIAATPDEAPGRQDSGAMKTIVRPLDISLLVCSHIHTRCLQRLVFVVLLEHCFSVRLTVRRRASPQSLVGSRWRIWQGRQASKLPHRMSPARIVVCANDEESRPAVVLHEVLQSAPTEDGASTRCIWDLDPQLGQAEIRAYHAEVSHHPTLFILAGTHQYNALQ